VRKIYSTVLHNPPHTYGDCFRACLASLLETDVPHVLHDNCNAGRQRQRIDLWLQPRGLAFVEFPLAVPTLKEALTFADTFTNYSGIHYLLSGLTHRDTGHYIVCCGAQVAHNPTPGSKIVKPFPDGVFWMGIIADRL
jgi:hypothetical protein